MSQVRKYDVSNPTGLQCEYSCHKRQRWNANTSITSSSNFSTPLARSDRNIHSCSTWPSIVLGLDES